MPELIARPPDEVAVVVTGRFGSPPTLRLEPRELPLLRFLERPRVDYPGIELVVDTELSVATDPYLEDHVFQGERLLPAVMGLEAIAQAAMAVTGRSDLPVLEDIHFERPIVVPREGKNEIRTAVLVDHPGQLRAVIRCQDTSFQLDHFRASCRWVDQVTPLRRKPKLPAFAELVKGPSPCLDPGADLYGDLLFHRGRFQRIEGYRKLKATECVAEIGIAGDLGWFGPYLPAELVLGDPAARDAVIHAIQACIPHATILPIGVERLFPARLDPHRRWIVEARERSRHGPEFVYDVDVFDESGEVRERWEGLRLRAVARHSTRSPWAVPLLGPYLERSLAELVPETLLSVVVERSKLPGRPGTDQALRRVLGREGPVTRGPHGAPDAMGSWKVSAAHAEDVVMAVTGPGIDRLRSRASRSP